MNGALRVDGEPDAKVHSAADTNVLQRRHRGRIEQGFEFRGELFAHLYVDGLWTLATAIWLGFERDPRAFVQRR